MLGLRRRRRVYLDDLPRTHDARFLLIFLIGLVATLAAIYGVGYVVAGDTVPPRTHVAGVDVGGMSRSRAEHAIVQAEADRLSQPLALVSGSSRDRAGVRRTTIIPSQSGVQLNVDATMRAVMHGGDADPAHMLAVLEGGGQIEPELSIDLSRLAAALAPLASSMALPPVDSSVTLRDGRPVVHIGHPGGRLDPAAAAQAIAAALRSGRHIVHLRLTPVTPDVPAPVITRFVSTVLRPALNAPIHVMVGSTAVLVPAGAFAPALRIQGSGATLALDIDSHQLWARTHGLLAHVAISPKDAAVTFTGNHAVASAGRSGRRVLPAQWAAAVLAAATAQQRRATAASAEAEPHISSTVAAELASGTPIATARGSAPGSMLGGVTLAAENLDGAILLPGDELSYARRVGQAAALTVLGPLGTAVQTAVEQAGLTVTQWPLVSPVGHDLKFRDSLSRPVCLHVWVDPLHAGKIVVHAQVWSPSG